MAAFNNRAVTYLSRARPVWPHQAHASSGILLSSSVTSHQGHKSHEQDRPGSVIMDHILLRHNETIPSERIKKVDLLMMMFIEEPQCVDVDDDRMW